MEVPSLRRIYIDIISKCNMNCPWCYYRKENKEMDYKQVLEIGKKFYLDKDKATILLLGGEPTLHSKFKEILRGLKKDGWSVSVITNGICPKNTLPVLQKYADEVQVSIDFYKEREDKFKNTPKAFEKKIYTVNYLENSFIRTTIMKNNLQDIENILNLCIRMGRDWVGVPIKPLNPEARSQMLSISEFIRISNLVIDYAAQTDLTFYIDHPLYFCYDKGWRDKMYSRGYFCPAGHLHCSIKINGDVTPCLFMDGPVLGNVFRDGYTYLRENLLSFAKNQKPFMPICLLEF